MDTTPVELSRRLQTLNWPRELACEGCHIGNFITMNLDAMFGMHALLVIHLFPIEQVRALRPLGPSSTHAFSSVSWNAPVVEGQLGSSSL